MKDFADNVIFSGRISGLSNNIDKFGKPLSKIHQIPRATMAKSRFFLQPAEYLCAHIFGKYGFRRQTLFFINFLLQSKIE